MKRVLLQLLLLLSITPLTAQNDTTTVTTPASASRWERLLAHLPHLSGFVQAGYRLSEEESTFLVKRARLDLQGDLSPKFDYRLQVEFASKVQIVDAYVAYHPKPYLNFKLGQYKIPFSIASTHYGPLRLEVIEYATVLRSLMAYAEPIGGTMHKASGRDMGLTIYGGFGRREGRDLVTYDVAVLNGSGINTKDHNRSKDVAVRLMVHPVRGLTLSGSYFKGEFGSEYLRRDRYAVGACYDRDAVVVRGEWIGGRTGYSAKGATATETGTPAGVLRSDGWYLLTGWRVTEKWMPVMQYDVFSADVRNRSTTRQRNYTIGVLWQPIKHLRCQLNYTREQYAAAPNRNVGCLLLTGLF